MNFKKSARPFLAVTVSIVAMVLSGCQEKETSKAAPSTAAATVGAASGSTVVATVNGATLTNMDLAGLLTQGADRAIAVDRAIQRTLAAQLAEKEYTKETEAARESAGRDAAAQVYLSKKYEESLKSVSDKDVETRYTQFSTGTDFNAYRIKFALFPSQEEAIATLEKLKQSPPDSRFENLTKEDVYVSRENVPYGMGALVSQLKKGEYSQPAATRNGFIVFYQNDIKTNPKPKLEDLKAQIRNVIAQERVAQALAAARQSADITLK